MILTCNWCRTSSIRWRPIGNLARHNESTLNSHDLLLQALRQPEGWRTLPEGWLEEQVRLYPWFAAPRMLLARRDADTDATTLTSAAVHAFSRARLKAWMTAELDAQLRSLTEGLSGEGGSFGLATESETAGLEGSIEPFVADAAVERESEVLPAVLPEVLPEPEVLPAVLPEPEVLPAVLPEPEAVSKGEPNPEPVPDTQPQLAEAKTFGEWLAGYAGSRPGLPGTAPDAGPSDTPPFALPNTPIADAEMPVTAGGGRLEPPPSIAAALPAVFEPAVSEIGLGGDSQQLDALIERQRALRARRFGAVASGDPVSGPAATGHVLSDAQDPTLTETYAGILAAQGKWAEAEAIYQALSLRYPEKSGFFANLIREIQEKKNA